MIAGHLRQGESTHARRVFVNPHNPTASSRYRALKGLRPTVSRQALVIVDEAYLEFADHFRNARSRICARR